MEHELPLQQEEHRMEHELPLQDTGPSITALVSSSETDGAFALEILSLPPYGAGPSDHIHSHGEGHYVLSGTLAATLGERTVMVRAGSAIHVEPGIAHSCWNPGASPAVVLLIQVPPPGGS